MVPQLGLGKAKILAILFYTSAETTEHSVLHICIKIYGNLKLAEKKRKMKKKRRTTHNLIIV